MNPRTGAYAAPTALAALIMLAAAPALQAAEPSFADAMLGGKPKFNLRLRLENVDDDAFAKSASAPTYRARFGYETRPWQHWSALVEVDYLGVWGGEAYNSTRNGRVNRPQVTDPPALDLNQALLKYSSASDDLLLGRQRIVQDNQRFIGGSGWRQNEQTFDALTWRTRRLPRTTVSYSYVDNVNRVFGPDAGTPPPDLRTHAHLLNAQLDLHAAGKLTALAQWIDVRNSAALSHQNAGLLWTGSYKLDSTWSLPWSASWVRQGDYGNNPTHYDADYYQLELGVSRKAFALRLGLEVLGGDATRNEHRFQTPLATLHAFQGWADKFLTTPPQGVRDEYVVVTGNRWGIDGQLAWHDFRADAVSKHYGSEWDASLSHKFGTRTELLLKYASYNAAQFAADTRKFWVQLNLDLP